VVAFSLANTGGLCCFPHDFEVDEAVDGDRLDQAAAELATDGSLCRAVCTVVVGPAASVEIDSCALDVDPEYVPATNPDTADGPRPGGTLRCSGRKQEYCK
jgi:hypothetical protein